MNAIGLMVSLICFMGDGLPSGEFCISPAGGGPDTVLECDAVGDSTVPLNINTGTSNPGDGFVQLWSTGPGEPVLLGEYDFDSRGYSSYRPSDAAIYIARPRSMSLKDGFEDEPFHPTCVCHSVYDGECRAPLP